MHLRRSKERDRNRVMAIARKFSDDINLADKKERLSEAIGTDRVMVACQDNDKALGFTYAYLKGAGHHLYKPGRSELYVSALCVESEHQRKGAGKALLSELISSNGHHKISCAVNASNKAGMALLSKCGFKLSGKVHQYMRVVDGVTASIEPTLTKHLRPFEVTSVEEPSLDVPEEAEVPAYAVEAVAEVFLNDRRLDPESKGQDIVKYFEAWYEYVFPRKFPSLKGKANDAFEERLRTFVEREGKVRLSSVTTAAAGDALFKKNSDSLKAAVEGAIQAAVKTADMPVQRYSLKFFEEMGLDGDSDLVEDANGEWVKWVDVERLLKSGSVIANKNLDRLRRKAEVLDAPVTEPEGIYGRPEMDKLDEVEVGAIYQQPSTDQGPQPAPSPLQDSLGLSLLEELDALVGIAPLSQDFLPTAQEPSNVMPTVEKVVTEVPHNEDVTAHGLTQRPPEITPAVEEREFAPKTLLEVEEQQGNIQTAVDGMYLTKNSDVPKISEQTVASLNRLKEKALKLGAHSDFDRELYKGAVARFLEKYPQEAMKDIWVLKAGAPGQWNGDLGKSAAFPDGFYWHGQANSAWHAKYQMLEAALGQETTASLKEGKSRTDLLVQPGVRDVWRPDVVPKTIKQVAEAPGKKPLMLVTTDVPDVDVGIAPKSIVDIENNQNEVTDFLIAPPVLDEAVPKNLTELRDAESPKEELLLPRAGGEWEPLHPAEEEMEQQESESHVGLDFEPEPDNDEPDEDLVKDRLKQLKKKKLDQGPVSHIQDQPQPSSEGGDDKTHHGSKTAAELVTVTDKYLTIRHISGDPHITFYFDEKGEVVGIENPWNLKGSSEFQKYHTTASEYLFGGVHNSKEFEMVAQALGPGYIVEDLDLLSWLDEMSEESARVSTKAYEKRQERFNIGGSQDSMAFNSKR